MVKPYAGSRNPRLVRLSRGGSMTDETHRALAHWAAACAARVLPLFPAQDARPAEAIEAARRWAEGGITTMEARAFATRAHAAAREATGAAQYAARAAGHAVATAHMADHALGGAYYALKALQVAAPGQVEEERRWQLQALTPDIEALVLEDMALRAAKFHGIFTREGSEKRP